MPACEAVAKLTTEEYERFIEAVSQLDFIAVEGDDGWLSDKELEGKKLVVETLQLNDDYYMVIIECVRSYKLRRDMEP